MGRIRTFKPELFLDEELAELDPLAVLAYMGLWTLADCEGRLEDRPGKIKAQIDPYRKRTDMNALLDALANAGFITRYVVEGRAYIQVRNFRKHQRLSGKEAVTDSLIPPPPESGAVIASPTLHDLSPTLQEGKGKRKEERGKDIVRVGEPPLDALEEIFLAMKQEYPGRSGSQGYAEAKKRLASLVKARVHPDQILAGIRRYRTWCDCTRTTGTTFVKAMSTFLSPSGRAWEEPYELPKTPYEDGPPGQRGKQTTLDLIREMRAE